MQPGNNLNGLSQVPCESALDSTTENNSESSDSDLEILSNGVGDQTRVIQGLKRTIRRKQTEINELTGKLTIADIHLASEKEKTRDKEVVISSLKTSIDVITQSKDLIIKALQSQLIELQTSLDSGKNKPVTKDCQNPKVTESDVMTIYNLSVKIEEMGFELKQKNNLLSDLKDKTQKYECSLREKDEHISKLEAQAEKDTAKISELLKKQSKGGATVDNSNALVLLNCTKIPSIKFVSLPPASRFAVVFEDLPSAGPGWMVIQRRIDGRVAFDTKGSNLDCFNGFGDLSREFWLGCDKIHVLTASRRHELYIELVDFDDAKAFARYDHFVVGGQAEHYKLKSLGQYSGNAGDFLRKSENNQYLVIKTLPGSEIYFEFFGWWIGAEW
nr:fibroleukin-like [Drosophila kikkawai]